MIEFYKMSGSGNDFILIDNRGKALNDIGIDLKSFAKSVCRNKVSVEPTGSSSSSPPTRPIFAGSFSMPTAARRRCAATGAAVPRGSPC